MNVARSAKAACACSNTLRTGPHIAVWQKAGVAMSSTVGLPVVSAWSSETACKEHAGVCVQIGVTPWLSASVGVGTDGNFSPDLGYGRVDGSTVCTCTAGPLSVLTVKKPGLGRAATSGQSGRCNPRVYRFTL